MAKHMKLKSGRMQRIDKIVAEAIYEQGVVKNKELGVHPKYRNGKARHADAKAWEAKEKDYINRNREAE